MLYSVLIAVKDLLKKMFDSFLENIEEKKNDRI